MESTCGVWCSTRRKKLPFLAELSHFCASNSEPMIVGGDFNIIRYIKEKNSLDGVHRHTPLFNDLIRFYELRELIMAGGMFTWSNNQENPVLEKLDKSSGDQRMGRLVPSGHCQKITQRGI